MPTRFINKALRLSDILNEPNASGIGVFGGMPYMNLNGALVPIGGAPFTNVILVDGDNGSDTDHRLPYKTIQAAVLAATRGDTILIRALDIDTAGVAAGTADDPPGYVGDITITAGLDGLRLIGIGNGIAQMGQPCIRVGTTTTNALLTIKAPGVGVYNLTINGSGGTGGGISLFADGALYDAGGAVIQGCHFKGCKNTGAATTGGAIQFPGGGCWYTTISDCDFFDCRGGVVVTTTSASIPKDIKILGCRFYSSAATNVDIDIYGKGGGSGVDGILIDSCVFGTVDGPVYAGAGNTQRYLDLTACIGIISNCAFSAICEGTGVKTLKAAGTLAFIPATVRCVSLRGEPFTDATLKTGIFFRSA